MKIATTVVENTPRNFSAVWNINNTKNRFSLKYDDNEFGVQELPDDGLYCGSFDNTKITGKGMVVNHAGDVCFCLKTNKSKIHAQMITKRGNLIRGVFETENSGHASIWFKNGNRYSGTFRNGRPHGKGVLKDFAGVKVFGTWNDGKRDGKAKILFPSGNLILLNYSDGVPKKDVVFRNKNKKHFHAKMEWTSKTVGMVSQGDTPLLLIYYAGERVIEIENQSAK